MAEVGIDTSAHTSDHVDRYVGENYDLALTVCDAARDACPVFPGAQLTHRHGFVDPDQPGLEEPALVELFRTVRDQIGEF
jgi:arsenate reductase